MPTALGSNGTPAEAQGQAAPPAIDWANVASEVRIMRQLDRRPGQHHQGPKSQVPTTSHQLNITGSRPHAAVMH